MKKPDNDTRVVAQPPRMLATEELRGVRGGTGNVGTAFESLLEPAEASAIRPGNHRAGKLTQST
jgi:hypothetical protein